MNVRHVLGLAAVAAVAGLASFVAAGALIVGTASGGPPNPQPLASGWQQIQSGPGVYAQTSPEYAGSWWWSQDSASYDYWWYVFTSGGSLVDSGHNGSGGGGSWTGAANIYYFKEYNNEPAGSGHINILTVNYCC